MSEQAREEFEKEWGIEMNPGVYFVPELNVYGADFYAQYEYASHKSSAWFYFRKGWQASRSAMVVELPAFSGYQHQIVLELQAAFTAAIEAAGLKVKP